MILLDNYEKFSYNKKNKVRQKRFRNDLYIFIDKKRRGSNLILPLFIFTFILFYPTAGFVIRFNKSLT